MKTILTYFSQKSISHGVKGVKISLADPVLYIYLTLTFSQDCYCILNASESHSSFSGSTREVISTFNARPKAAPNVRMPRSRYPGATSPLFIRTHARTRIRTHIKFEMREWRIGRFGLNVCSARIRNDWEHTRLVRSVGSYATGPVGSPSKSKSLSVRVRATGHARLSRARVAFCFLIREMSFKLNTEIIKYKNNVCFNK